MKRKLFRAELFLGCIIDLSWASSSLASDYSKHELDVLMKNHHPEFSETISSDLSTRTTETKRDKIWDDILKGQYVKIPFMTPLGWLGSSDLLISDTYIRDLTEPGDIRRYPSESPVFSKGTYFKCSWVAQPGTPYSGLFAQGNHQGLGKISLAWAPEGELTTPAVFFKFFSRSESSVNMKLMASWDPQADGHVFKPQYSNIQKNPVSSWYLSMLMAAQSQAYKVVKGPGSSPLEESLRPLANWSEEPLTRPEQTKAPYRLILKPTAESWGLMAGLEETKDFRFQLNHKGSDTILWLVYATDLSYDSETDRYLEGPEMLIGHIRADSDFVASKYGDQRVRFPIGMR